MYKSLDDTIAAIASAAGGAARGIVRISGPGAADCLAKIFVAADAAGAASGRAPGTVDGQCTIASLGVDIPCRLYWWPTSRSYTRQPLAELHAPGWPPLLDALLESLCAAGARLAAPGEFTLRAFLAGRIDLTQAEAVLGVIDAAGPAQLDAALAQLAGGLSGPLSGLRTKLLDLVADLEAGLDFADEDIQFISRQELTRTIGDCIARIKGLLEQMAGREVRGDEPAVVLAGLPNAGKSSLLNALAGHAAAIVSPRAGTTRDYVARRIDFDGIPCQVIDTAGAELAQIHAPVDQRAQQIACEQSQRADITLVCIDASRELTDWDRQQLAAEGQGRIVVWTKADLAPLAGADRPVIATSSVTGQGLAELRTKVAQAIAARPHEHSPVVAATAARCRTTLAGAAAALEDARGLAASGQGDELIAARLRDALDGIGQVAGAVYTEDILDRIFSRFCIGK